MATKPQLPKWVPGDEAARITDPGIAKRALGWIYTEKPPFQFMNWIHNIISHWLVGLQGGFFSVVVGTSTQVTNNEATHTISDLDDTVVINQAHVLFLQGDHVLTADITLNNNDLVLVCENGLAQIELGTFKLVLNGLAVRADLRINNGGTPALEVNGTFSMVRVAGVNIATAGKVVRVANSIVIAHSGIMADNIIVNGSAVMELFTTQEFIGQKNFSPSVALTWGANVAWDLDTEQVATLTLTGTTAQLDNPTNMKDGGTYAIKIIQDGTGGRLLTFGSAYKWPNGVLPIIPQGVNEYTWITFLSNGTNMDGVSPGGAFS